MTHDDPEELRDLTPEEEAEVSRLLAEAGGPLAVPDDVAARLDATLAELVQERGSVEDRPPAPVVPLTPRRRWPRLLLAAAAVVVGGYAVGTAVTDSSFSGDSAGSADSGAAGDVSEREADGSGGGDDSGGGAAAPESADESTTGPSRLAFQVVTLRSDRLQADVRSVLERRYLLYTGDAEAKTDARSELAALKAVRCPPPPLEKGYRWSPAKYDGVRSVLVTGPVDDGAVEAQVLGCDGEVLASVEVDRP